VRAGSAPLVPELPGRPERDDDPTVQGLGVAEYVAQQSSLHRVLAPRSVAVVGAGRQHGDAGHEALRALRDYGFRGSLFAVNRAGRPVCGVPVHRRISDLPTPVDLLVLAVPAVHLARALAEAGGVGARGAVLLGTGRPADDRPGKRQRGEILAAARRHGIRLLGPGCLGVINADPRVRLNASLAPVRPPGGGLALAARSGGVGIALLEDAVRNRCGISTFVSMGDELDVTVADLLGYWFDDPATRAVALSPESFGDPAGFARAAHALGRRKPVLAIGYRGPQGAGDDPLARAGVIRTAGLGETIDTARMLIDQPLPAGNRLAIVGNASGLVALTADTARAHGFEIVTLSDATCAKLPPAAGSGLRGNPVDLGIDASAERIAEATEAVLASGEADIVLPVLAGTRATVLIAIRTAVAHALDDHPQLTAAAVLTGSSDDVHRLGRRGAPVYHEPERAVRALAHARDYAAWRRTPLGPRTGQARAAVRRALAAGAGPATRQDTTEILSAYGIILDLPRHTQPDATAGSTAGPPAVVRTDPPARGVLAAGVRRDPEFGPAVLLECRTAAASPGDRAACMVPVSTGDAARMRRSLGYDGPVPPAEVEDLLLRLGRLAGDLPEVSRLDVGPIVAGPDGVVVAEAALRLAPVGPDQVARLSSPPGPVGPHLSTPLAERR
ncbi:MAG: hypothetical protein QOE51_5037, partial [Actinoplanes sp.]|nr:hypothetical protein [Actinoplanes sp.]